jgi:hypothetical protein
MSCNNDDDSNNEEGPITDLPEQQASFSVQGTATGNFTFTPNEFDAFPGGSGEIDLNLEEADLYRMEISLLGDEGYEVGTVITLEVSDDVKTNEITFVFEEFTTAHGQFFDSLAGGTVTITSNRDYEIQGGQFSGILLSGDVSFTAEDDDGNRITVTGSFTDFRVLTQG